MAFKIGSTNIVNVRKGSTDIDKVYVGSNLVWERNSSRTAFSLQNYATENSGAASCNLGSNNPIGFWHDGAGQDPIIGDFIYDSQIGGNTFDGGSAWYYNITASEGLQINSSGEVLDTYLC